MRLTTISHLRIMNQPNSFRFALESSRERLLRVRQPGYLLALLRSRSRLLQLVMTLCVSLGIYWELQSPTYQARVIVDHRDMCPHGRLINSFGLPPETDGQLCPICNPLPVAYSKPASESLQKIKIERVSLTDGQFRELAALAKTKAEFGSRWLVERRPDAMRPGPWTTRLYVFEATDARHCVRVELIDHASYDVRRTWLNDKMLFVRVWWGRMVSTDFVLDTETMKLAYAEDANYFKSVHPQEEGRER